MKVEISEVTSVKNVKKNDYHGSSGKTHGVMCRLGAFVGASYNAIRETGKTLGIAPARIASVLSKILRRSGKSSAQLSSPTEVIRAIVLEELARVQGLDGAISLGELEIRLRAMAETVEALQAKIAELSVAGNISEAEIWKVMDSIESAESLTNSERSVLVNIFRQNIALQKPELIETGVLK